MYRRRKPTVLLTVLMVAGATVAAWAAPGQSFNELPSFQEWLALYDEVNGDHNVVLPLAPSRFFATEQTKIRGYVELDLIDGDVVIQLRNLDREVDVWVLDNAVHTSVLPGDPGDNLIHLARLAPGDGKVVRVEKELGPETFRGFQLDWAFVSDAGVDPTESRLLISTRSYFERQYTRQRLAREGFDVAIPPLPRQRESYADFTKAIGIATEPHQILVTKGLVTQAQFDGANSFFRETFDGNGRTCGTCHPAQNNQTIDGPFINSLPASDPLFVAEQRPSTDPISKLEVPVLMRQFDLIVENVDGGENPTVKFVMRGVPHSLSIATSTNPNNGTTIGWSGDGAPAPGTVRFFLLGAIMQHYPNVSLKREPGIDFRLPTDEELDVTEEFMLNVGRLDDINLSTVVLSNADANSGRLSFINSGCNACHQNASANASFSVPPGQNLNLNTNVELLPKPAAQVEPTPLDAPEFPNDGGNGTASAPNRDCDGDGDLDCFGNGNFNTAPLIEAADTAPFFHNNTAATIEDAVRFYGGPPFAPPAQPIFPNDPVTVNRVGAFLRVMNASFNLQIAIQRNEAALVLTPGGFAPESNGVKATVNKLLDLSNDESEDALQVLTGGPLGNLGPTATSAIQSAISFNNQAIAATSNSQRRSLIIKALDQLKAANSSLGSGTGFKLGTGNLLF